MPFYGTIEYIPDDSGTAIKVKCPLVDDWIDPVDCMENQEIKDAYIPSKYKKKTDWKEICEACPLRDY